MKIVKNKSTEDNREFWSHVENVAKEVDSWPTWMAKNSDEQSSNTACDQPHASNPQKEPLSE